MFLSSLWVLGIVWPLASYRLFPQPQRTSPSPTLCTHQYSSRNLRGPSADLQSYISLCQSLLSIPTCVLASFSSSNCNLSPQFICFYYLFLCYRLNSPGCQVRQFKTHRSVAALLFNICNSLFSTCLWQDSGSHNFVLNDEVFLIQKTQPKKVTHSPTAKR